MGRTLLNAGSVPSSLRNEMTCIDIAKHVRSGIAIKMLQSVDSKSDKKGVQSNVANILLSKVKDIKKFQDDIERTFYCQISHRSSDFLLKEQTKSLKTSTPEWNESFILVIKKSSIYYRDVTLRLFAKDPESSGEDECIGQAFVSLEPLKVIENLTLNFLDATGVTATLDISIEYFHKSDSDISKLYKKSYSKYDATVKKQKFIFLSNKESLGKAKAKLGFKPEYPVVLVPGIASSVLECWQSDTNSWVNQRIWLDPFKMVDRPSAQIAEKLNFNELKKIGYLDSRQKRWLKHLLLDPSDRISDPPGIKVRPAEGIHAIDYLSDSPLLKTPTFCFGEMIKELSNVGYSPENLHALPYDWRLPPAELEKRDRLLTKLKLKIEEMKELNQQKVVILAHSMGNKLPHYFLSWVELKSPGWCDDNIHALMSLAPPFLGSPKTVRSVIYGDLAGLDTFLSIDEGREIHRGMAVLPWLFPVKAHHLPDVNIRIASSEKSKEPKR